MSRAKKKEKVNFFAQNDLIGDIEDALLIAELHRRIARDNGVRHTFSEVLATLGFTLADLEDEPLDCPIQDRCCCGPQPDDRVILHRRGSDRCRAGES